MYRIPTKAVRQVLTILTGITLVCGCVAHEAGRHQVPSIRLKLMKRGMSPEEVRDVLGVAGRHEFLVRRAGVTVRCSSVLVSPAHYRLYCVFTNERLEKVVRRPRYPHEIGEQETVRQKFQAVWLSHDPWDRVKVVMDATNILSDEGIRGIRSWSRSAGGYKDLPGFITAWLIAAPVAVPRDVVMSLQYGELLRKYDPGLIELGTAREEVERIYGSAKVCDAEGRCALMCYYGDDQWGAYDPELWVLVGFDCDSVVAVFGGDFLNLPRLEELLREKGAGGGSRSAE